MVNIFFQTKFILTRGEYGKASYPTAKPIFSSGIDKFHGKGDCIDVSIVHGWENHFF